MAPPPMQSQRKQKFLFPHGIVVIFLLTLGLVIYVAWPLMR
jgi:hypothetical protein